MGEARSVAAHQQLDIRLHFSRLREARISYQGSRTHSLLPLAMGDLPPSIGDKLWPLSRFIGYRREEHLNDDGAHPAGAMLPETAHPKPRHQISRRLGKLRDNKAFQKGAHVCLTFLGSFFGVALIATMTRSAAFSGGTRSAPIVAGSFGAEAVLLYAAHESPLTQPRNVIFGNAVSAVIGVALAKGFTQLPGFQIGEVGDANWAAAALAVSCAIAAMQLLEVTHPPGGATALLAVTIPAVYRLSWFYVADIVASSCVMLAWALITNNLGNRRYATYWISPALQRKG